MVESKHEEAARAFAEVLDKASHVRSGSFEYRVRQIISEARDVLKRYPEYSEAKHQ